MRFVQDKEQVRWFLGRMFLRGQPVEVTDRGTIEALSKDSFFRRCDEEVKRQETRSEGLLENQCKKCFKVVKQGRYMHERFCKG